MFGLGVAHAQDRLWQMETHRRIGAGRLAEAFGDSALDTDRFLRALGVRACRGRAVGPGADAGRARRCRPMPTASTRCCARPCARGRPSS